MPGTVNVAALAVAGATTAALTPTTAATAVRPVWFFLRCLPMWVEAFPCESIPEGIEGDGRSAGRG